MARPHLYPALVARGHDGVKPRIEPALSITSARFVALRSVSPGRSGPLRALASGLLVALLLMAPQAWSVWNRGTFLDPDDAMRAVEVRDFLAGQPWFDLVPHRLAPDHPFPMHWSRLVDAPLAALQRMFGIVLPNDPAERAMRIVAPVLFFIAALCATLRLTTSTVGRRGRLPAALLLASSVQPLTNFLPGHIHHHGIQAALLLAATAALVEIAGTEARAQWAAAAGGLAMLSLGIGLQNLPFVIGLIGTSGGLWIARGPAQSRCLGAFGLGLLTAAPVFGLDVPPGRYGDTACDSFSAAHLVAASGTAAVCLALAALTPWLARWPARLGAAGVGAALVLGLTAWFAPNCLHDPMAAVDPLLRDAWLSGVGEALPLGRLIVLSPSQGITLLLTLMAGLGATAMAAWNASPARRGRWAVLLVLVAIGIAGSLWQVRVAASTCTLAVPGLAWAVLRVFDHARRHPRAPALFLAVLAGAFGNGAGWAAVAMPFGRASGRHAVLAPDPAACFDPASFTALAALRPGLVLSTIDPGSALLAYTPHTVLAAPYHRNTYGNRLSILALAAPVEEARALMAGAGVGYLALCRASNETAETVATHPDSLSAALMAGRVPDWLIPLGAPDATFMVYRLRVDPSGTETVRPGQP